MDRTSTSLLKCLGDLITHHKGDEAAMYETFVYNSIFNKGDGNLKKIAPQGKGKGGKLNEVPEEGPIAPEQDVAPPAIDNTKTDNWPVIVAQMLAKVANSMQREILEGKLMSYFSEWCDARSPRVEGACYSDAIILYAKDDGGPEFLQHRSPWNNIYLGFHCDFLAVDRKN